MVKKIRIRYEDGTEDVFDYDEDFCHPLSHALAILEVFFQKEAEKGEIYSDGERWYLDGAEATWYENEDENDE